MSSALSLAPKAGVPFLPLTPLVDGCLMAFVVVRDVSLEIVLLMSALTVNDVVSSNHVFWVRHLVPEGQPIDSKKMIL